MRPHNDSSLLRAGKERVGAPNTPSWTGSSDRLRRQFGGISFGPKLGTPMPYHVVSRNLSTTIVRNNSSHLFDTDTSITGFANWRVGTICMHDAVATDLAEDIIAGYRHLRLLNR